MAINRLKMIQLQKSAPLISKILREQVYDSLEEYRWASYVCKISLNDGILAYNVLTKELLLIKDMDSDKELLVKKWFLVVSSFNEKEQIERVKLLLSIIPNASGGIDNYTIFTTTDCNAKCYYCFEKDSPKVRMNDEIVAQTVQFIKHNYSGKEILIQWFGGEPLFNIKVINRISEYLNSNNIFFNSSMTSNGYLFNEKVIKRAVEEWHLKNIQITLDGTKENYNRIKSYIHKDKNPFERVLRNIENLLNHSIYVTIRLNLSLDNSNDMIILLKQLVERFKGSKFLIIYPHPLFELIVNDESRKEVFEKLMYIQKIIDDNHFSQDYVCFKKPRLTHCKADNNGHSVVIFPDGNIGLCDHKFGNNYIGHVSNYNIDHNIVKNWKKYKEPIQKCSTCLIYPDCMKLELCDTNNNCYNEYIEIDTHILKQTMIKSYKNTVKNETEI